MGGADCQPRPGPFDTTVTASPTTIIDRSFLMALRDPAVVAMAARFGDPVDLLEGCVA